MNIKKKTLILLFLIIFFISINVNAATTLKRMLVSSNRMIKKISVNDAYRWYQNKKALFIDVDEPAEFNSLTIPGSINIPRGVLEFKIGRYANKNTLIVIFSKRGDRGILSVYNLQGLGYNNVYNINGGLLRWKSARFPVKIHKKAQTIPQIRKKRIIRRIK